MQPTKPCNDICFALCVDKTEAHVHDCLTYELRLCNLTPYPISSIYIKDSIQEGIEIISNSLYVSKEYEGTLDTGIRIKEDLKECEEVIIRYSGIVLDQTCSGIEKQACLTYQINTETYTCNSNVVCTNIFEQYLKELYTSIAYVEAALSSITNVEGAKIQKLVSMADVTSDNLLRVNASVQDVLEIITMFEMVLKRKATIAKKLEVKICI